METENNKVLQVKVKYFKDDCKRLKKIAIGDWIDLCADENVEIKQGEYKQIKLGIAMELPEGYEAHIAPRSSTFKNFGIMQTNSIGIVDNSYCGDNDQWMMPVVCVNPISEGKTWIMRGDRIAQFRIMKKQPHINFVEVESLGNEDRGGFGRTGIK